jgi:CubicO group peptidase (beta-lactamase class C family)
MIKATLNPHCSIASIFKSLTATGIMKLYEMGKLDLDTDIEKYIAPMNLKYYVNDCMNTYM